MAIKELEGLKIPKHIAIILDGNRRYAKKNSLNPLKGHDDGAKTFENLLNWVEEIGEIKSITAYTFSLNNFNREHKEVEHLMNLFRRWFKRFSNDERITKHKVKINFIGRLNKFPDDVQQLMNELMEKTEDNQGYTINFAMGYGGREEITDSCKKIAAKVKSGEIKLEEINKEIVGKYMYMNEDVDLIIRTSGEKRISDFLPWQSNYAELFFIDKYWPEFTKEDLIEIIKEFNSRQRRFGE